MGIMCAVPQAEREVVTTFKKSLITAEEKLWFGNLLTHGEVLREIASRYITQRLTENDITKNDLGSALQIKAFFKEWLTYNCDELNFEGSNDLYQQLVKDGKEVISVNLNTLIDGKTYEEIISEIYDLKLYAMVPTETGTMFILRKPELTRLSALSDTLNKIQTIIETQPQFVKGKKKVYSYRGKEYTTVSVSDLVNPNQRYSKETTIAMALGTMVDTITRDFFDPLSDLSALWKEWQSSSENSSLIEKLNTFISKRYADNISKEGLKLLLQDLNTVREQIYNTWGTDAKIISTEFSMIGREIKEDGKYGRYVIGQTDLIVVDKGGIAHIVDVKTKLANETDPDFVGAHSEYNQQALMRYKKLIQHYIALLRLYGVEVDEHPNLLIVDTFYLLKEINVTKLENGEKVQKKVNRFSVEQGAYKRVPEIKVIYEDGTEETLSKYIERESEERKKSGELLESPGELVRKSTPYKLASSDQVGYREPRLHLITLHNDQRETTLAIEGIRRYDDDVKTDYITAFDEAFNNLNTDEKTFIYETLGIPNVNMRTRVIESVDNGPSRGVFSRPELISNTEIQDVANYIAYAIYDYIQEEKLNGESDTQAMMRLGGPETVFNYIVESTLETDDTMPMLDNYDDGASFYEAQQLYYKKKHLIQYSNDLKFLADKLMKELFPGLSNKRYEDEDLESGDQDTMEGVEDGVLDHEAWMFGTRRRSVKVSKSAAMRRLLHTIQLRGENGKDLATDKYGYGFIAHLNPSVVSNVLHEWLTDCETLDEMLNTLEQRRRQGETWVEDVINLITEEDNIDDSNKAAKIAARQVKNQFFGNFRLDFIKYCIVKERLEDGQLVYRTEIINLKSAEKTMMFSVRGEFKDGSNPLYIKNGKMSIEYNREILNDINTLIKKLKTIFNATFANKESYNIKKHPEQVEEITKRFLDSSSDLFSITFGIERMSFVRALTRTLQNIGIKVNEEVVKNTVLNNISGAGSCNAMRMLSIMKYIMSQLSDSNNRSTIEARGYNPIAKGSKNGIYTRLETLVSILGNQVREYAESFSYVNGKSYYSYTNPSRLCHIIRNLANRRGRSQEEYKRYLNDNYLCYDWFRNIDENGNIVILNNWLSRLYNSTTTDRRSMIDHKVELSFLGTEYQDLGGLGFMMSLLSQFRGSMDEDPNTAWYGVPTMSNKTTSEFIKGPRYVGKGYEGRIIDDTLVPTCFQEIKRIVDVLDSFQTGRSNNLKDYCLKEKSLKKYFKKLKLSDSEITKRINELKEHIQEHAVTVEDMEMLGHVVSGAKFHFLPFLSAAFSADAQGDLKNIGEAIVKRINALLEGDQSKDQLDTGKLKFVLLDLMNQVVDREVTRLIDLGIGKQDTIKYNETEITQFTIAEKLGLIDKKSQVSEMEQIRAALTNFIWNDIAANINIIQLTGIDLAYYGNDVTYQKRIAMIHSPGTWGNFSDELCDGNLRSITVNDIEMVAECLTVAESVLDEHVKELQKKDKENGTHYAEEAQILVELAKVLFENVNVTDGQSVTSPTGMKKKLDALGKWSPELEEAFEKIRRGELTNEALGVVIQPVKPFLTTVVKKYSGSKTMELRPVPLQDKNSEYLLVLAEALGEGLGHSTRMSALFKFMEETHYLDKEQTIPSKHGIDTVHVESVCKVGLGKVITLKEDATEAEIIETLRNETAIPNEDMRQKAEKLGLDPNYNNETVDTYPAWSWIEQQETPMHFIAGHKQLYGSQMRLLGYSDITDGTVFQVSENETISKEALVEEITSLLAENIDDCANKLREELNIGGGDKEVLKKLSDLIRDELRHDTRFSSELFFACEMINDEMLVPTYDPIHGNRIQMLLFSLIKKTVNKQRINGGSLVQSSIFDRSKALHIVFKSKDGGILMFMDEFNERKAKGELPEYEDYRDYVDKNQNGIACFECYAPIPPQFEPFMQVTEVNEKGEQTTRYRTMGELEEILTKLGRNDLFEASTKMIDNRIPTEDKYSMHALRNKGFLPKVSGQRLVLPAEITAISSCDFDIDKMNLMLLEFFLKPIEDDEFVSRYRILTGDSSSSDADILSSKKKVKRYTQREIDRLSIAERKKFFAFKNIYDQIMISTLEVVPHEESSNRATRIAGRNNRVFDLQYSVLTNKDTVPRILNPSNFEVIKRTDRILRILQNELINPASDSVYTEQELLQIYRKEGLQGLDDILGEVSHPIIYTTSKEYFQQQNMQGTAMVGIFANHNVSHAVCSEQNITVNLKQNSFYFDGVQIGNPDNPTKLDPIVGHSGRYVSRVIAECVSAGTDTAKDPALRSLNINTCTGTVAMALARLGFDTSIIGFFLAQPILLKVVDTYFRETTLRGYYTVEDAVADVFYEEFNERAENLTSDDNMALIRASENNREVFSKESLLSNITNKTKDEYQKRVLLAFNQLLKISNDLTELTFCTKFNSVTNAGGPTIAKSLNMIDRVNNFISRVDSGTTVFNEEAKNVIQNNPILKAMYENTIGGDNSLMQQMMGNHFAELFEGFSEVRKKVLTSYTSNTRLSEKLTTKLVNAYMYFLLTYANKETGVKATIPTDRADLEYLIEKMPEVFIAAKNFAIKNHIQNILFNTDGIGLFTSAASEKIPVSTLGFPSGGLDIMTQDDVRNAWADLICSKHSVLREFGHMLFFYTLARNGFNFSPNTLMHLSSIAVRLNARFTGRADSEEDFEFAKYIEGMKAIKPGDNNIGLDQIVANAGDTYIVAFIEQFIRNNPNEYALCPIIELGGEGYTMQLDEDAELLTIDLDMGNKPIPGKIRIDNDTPYPFIRLRTTVDNKIQTKLYKIVGDYTQKGAIELTYKEISPLGVPGEFIEYNMNEDSDMQSMFTSIEILSVPDSQEDPMERPQQSYDLNPHQDRKTVNIGDVIVLLRDAVQETMVDGEIKKEVMKAITRGLRGFSWESIAASDVQQSVLGAIQRSIIETGNRTEEEIQPVLDEINKVCEENNLCK